MQISSENLSNQLWQIAQEDKSISSLEEIEVNNPKDLFRKFLVLDPTPDQRYREIITRYLKGEFFLSDLGHVQNMMILFQKNEISIQSDKSLNDILDDMFPSLQDKAFIHQDMVRREFHDIYHETEFLINEHQKGFKMVSPLSLQSAIYWSKHTNWGFEEDPKLFFEHAKNPILITMFKNGKKSKFTTKKTSISFGGLFDQNNDYVGWKEIQDNWDYYCWMEKLIPFYPQLLWKIPRQKQKKNCMKYLFEKMHGF